MFEGIDLLDGVDPPCERDGHYQYDSTAHCGECDIHLCAACWCVHRCGKSDADRCSHPEHQYIYPVVASVKLGGGGTTYWNVVTLTVNGEATEIWKGDDWHHGQAAAGLARRVLRCIPHVQVHHD